VNLHAIVSGAIGVVNPFITATLKRSTGYTTSADGTQTPTYLTLTGLIQVQAMSGTDLKRENFLNIQGTQRNVYIKGNWTGVIRTDQKGGDVMSFGETPKCPVRDWKVLQVLETWPQWSKVVVVMQ
jgi:hypothetical protein